MGSFDDGWTYSDEGAATCGECGAVVVSEPLELQVGQRLFGFLGGIFGRDHYGPCTIEAVGKDWIVVRNDNGTTNHAGGLDQEKARRMMQDSQDWGDR